MDEQILIFLLFQGSAVLGTLIQRYFAQLDENGTLASTVKDKVHEADRKKKLYEKKVREFRDFRDAHLVLPDLD